MPKEVKSKKEAKPWKGICSKACWFARGKRCRCKCRGQNHQKGLDKKAAEVSNEKR